LPAFAPDAAFRAKLANLSLVSQRPHGHLHTGGRRSRATGSSLEFADHRSYSPGDDYRQIDWNIYARTDELFVKVRESEETLVVHLLLDVSGSMASGAPAKFETARAVQAAIGWTALASRDVVAGAALGAGLGEAFAPRQGEGYFGRFLEFLQRQQPAGATGLSRAVAAYNARALPHGVSVLVSDLLAEDAPRAIGALAQRGHELTVLHVLDDEFANPAFADEVGNAAHVVGGNHDQQVVGAGDEVDSLYLIEACDSPGYSVVANARLRFEGDLYDRVHG